MEVDPAAPGAVPEPRYPLKGVYKPPPAALPPKPKPVPKPGLLADEALSSASTTPKTSPTTAEAASSSTAAALPSPMASAPERPEGPVTYSVRTFGQMDRECGYVNSRGDRVPRRRISQDGDLEVYRQDGLVEVFPKAGADQQERCFQRCAKGSSGDLLCGPTFAAAMEIFNRKKKH